MNSSPFLRMAHLLLLDRPPILGIERRKCYCILKYWEFDYMLEDLPSKYVLLEEEAGLMAASSMITSSILTSVDWLVEDAASSGWSRLHLGFWEGSVHPRFSIGHRRSKSIEFNERKLDRRIQHKFGWWSVFSFEHRAITKYHHTTPWNSWER